VNERALLDLVAGHDRGVLAAVKRDGRPQLSMVNYGWHESIRTAVVSSVADRAKIHNLRRDPRGSLLVSSDDGWAYAVLEGTVTLSAVAADPADEVVEELVEVYRTIRGEHPDWDEYRTVMVADGRLVIRLTVERVYGLAPQST
jgi:PPOX class probable F420-dependent enzyme